MAVFTIQNVPDHLKKQFKEACIENKKSMAEVTRDLMMDYIAESHARAQERSPEEVQAEEVVSSLGFDGEN